MARTTKNNIKKKDEPKPVHTCGECGWIWPGTRVVYNARLSKITVLYVRKKRATNGK